MIKTKLTNDMKHYMKEKATNKAAEYKLTGIRMAIAAIKNKEIEMKRELTDEEVISVLKKQTKEHFESMSFYKEDDIDNRKPYILYIDALDKFIPEDMSEEEAKKIISKALADANITEKKQMGDAMKTVMPILKGKLDGKVIKNIVTSILK